jgi:hypothetical protein
VISSSLTCISSVENALPVKRKCSTGGSDCQGVSGADPFRIFRAARRKNGGFFGLAREKIIKKYKTKTFWSLKAPLSVLFFT